MKGPIGRRKKNRMFMQIIKSRKKQRQTMRKFVLRENNFYQLVDFSVTDYFAVNFQKAIVFSHHFPQALVLSLNFHVLRDVIRVGFW